MKSRSWPVATYFPHISRRISPNFQQSSDAGIVSPGHPQKPRIDSPRLPSHVQCHVGPHPHADRLQGDKARAPLPVGDLPGGPRPRLAEYPEKEIQETTDLADVVGDI